MTAAERPVERTVLALAPRIDSSGDGTCPGPVDKLRVAGTYDTP